MVRILGRGPRPTLPSVDRVLVTGGAGFVGANFVHHLVGRHRRRGHRPRQADLRGQRGVPRRPPPGPGPARRGRRRRPDRGRPAGRRARRGRALRRGVPQRQLAHRPGAVRAHQPGRDVHASGGGPQGRDPAAPHLHRRGVRRPRARRPGPVHRGHGVPAEQPLLRQQGRLRPPGPRLGAQLRGPRHDLQLLEQLRPLAARREVHPPPDHQPHRRRPPQGLRRRAQRARLDPRRATTRPPCGRSCGTAGSARPT